MDMRTDFQDYDVYSGQYSWENGRGRFDGYFRAYPDGKLVGVLNDDGVEDVKKLVLGTINDKGMVFWKFNPIFSYAPLVWVLDRESDTDYSGTWGSIEVSTPKLIEGTDGKEGLRELSIAFAAHRVGYILQILGDIEKSRIDAYLDPKLISDIRGLSQRTGRLCLEERRAISF